MFIASTSFLPTVFGRHLRFQKRYFDMVGYGQHTPVLKRSMGRIRWTLHIKPFATKAECLDLPKPRHRAQGRAGTRRYEVYKDLVRQLGELGKAKSRHQNLTRATPFVAAYGGFLGPMRETQPKRISTAKQAALEITSMTCCRKAKSGDYGAVHSGDQRQLRNLEKKETGIR
jgi:hypothetical protein